MGPVRKIGDDAFTFPTGDSGQYGPVGISAPGTVTDQIDAAYWLANPQTNIGSTLGTGLTALSIVEYWQITGPDAISMTIDAATGVFSFTVAPDYEANGSAASSNTYSVTVMVVDSGGLQDSVGIEVTVTDVVETINAPTIDTPVNSGDEVNAASAGGLEITGNADPGITVTVTITDDLGATASETVIADASGNYTATIDVSGLDDGTLDVAAVAKDGTGNQSAPATTTTTLDTMAPAPVISGAPAGHDGSMAFTLNVDFGEDVTGFASGDVSAINGTVDSVTGGPQSWADESEGYSGDFSVID